MSAAKFNRCLTGFSGIQKPDRSGLPYGVRCAGAFRSTLPSAVRGTRFHGYESHCAPATTLMAHTIAREAKGIHSACLNVRIMSLPLLKMGRMLYRVPRPLRRDFV